MPIFKGVFMKKLLLITCLLGAVGPVKAMDSQVLYEKNGVVITQSDVDRFRSGTILEGRFNELHPTIAALVPELQGRGYGDYRMAHSWMPNKVHSFSNQMCAKFAELKSPPAPSAPKAPSSPPAPQPSAPQPAATPVIKPPVPAGKPATPAAQPVPIPVKSTVIVDTKYIIGVACAVLAVWIAYQWYEAWSEDTDDEGKNN
jgi:hypothetical protein